MKRNEPIMRKVLLLLIISMCICFVSCESLNHIELEEKPENENAFTYTESSDAWLANQPSLTLLSRMFGVGDYLYYKNNISLIRYNTTTGNKTYVCSDALCTHNTQECPFYGYDDFGKAAILYNDMLYYYVYYDTPIYIDKTLDHIENTRNFMYYNLSTGDSGTILEDFSISVGESIICDNFYYYYQSYQLENDDVKYYLNRINLEKNKIDEQLMLAAFDGTAPYNLIYSDDSNIYFASYALGELFSCPTSNFSEKNIIYQAESGYVMEHITFNDSWFYFILRNISTNENSLCRVSVNGDDYNNIYTFDNILRNVYYTESYMYYSFDLLKTIGIVEDTGETLNIPEPSVYRLNYTSNTPSSELAFKFPDDMATYSLNHFIVSDNYIYSFYTTWGELNEKYKSTDGRNSEDTREIMRIDITTGDIYYIN